MPSDRPDLLIRAARPADAEAISTLCDMPGFRFGTLRLPHRGPDETRRHLEAVGPEDVALVAERGGAVLGTAGWMRFKGRRHHVARIGMGVHDAHVGRGIGSALLGALLEAADRWYGLRRLELDVYTDNARAIGLYRRHGFEDEGISRADAFRDGRFVDTLRMARIRAPG